MSNERSERLAQFITEIGEVYARRGFVIEVKQGSLEAELDIIDLRDEPAPYRRNYTEGGMVDLYCTEKFDMVRFYDLGGRFPGDECY